MKINENIVKFSTDKKVYANFGALGLLPPNKHNKYWTITEGGNRLDSRKLTIEELLELADYMLFNWDEFRRDLMA